VEAQVRESLPALRLLGGVRWRGVPIVGERAQALLAILTRHPRDEVADARLVEEIWGDEPPANPIKALQVVVSRARAATSPEVIERSSRGYRLGLPAGSVDVLALGRLVEQARARLDAGEVGAARTAARAAVELAGPDGEAFLPGALGALRREAAEGCCRARMLLGMALSVGGEHEAAFDLLRVAAERDPGDERLLVCLLRSEAAVRGVGAALGRYERYRSGLVEATGADPGPELRALHDELLVGDRPVREGVRFEASELLGREADIRELRGLLRGSRIVSIVGSGGLGKTRLAHVIGRAADQPVVRMVELVGVAAAEDVVGEVGSALGVRDSVTGRRSLTAQQRADVRSRIAAALDQVSTLLILDNCEHVIEAVAELVAYLVLNTRTLRVLTTSRAPLNVAGERVYALDQLVTEHAAELFRQRATAARPGAALPEPAVAEIVARLDGLPLAIELAAAKVRAMSVWDVAARLENRFALLRGGDRSAPDRHQTLLAVIDWSWNLLSESDRAALRWLSVFHDGFTLAAAETVLGAGALESVQNLADQSLLTVRDTEVGVRYGMLETVGEFGRMQLVDAGEDAAAYAAQRVWARGYARSTEADLHGPNQSAAMDLLRAEETNLTDVLRRALGEPDQATIVVVLAALGRYWTIRGEHERLLVLVEAFEQALVEWTPPPELADAARAALTEMANLVFMLGRGASSPIWTLLRNLGPDSERPEIAAMTKVTLAVDPELSAKGERIRRLCEDPEPLVAVFALLMRAHERENAGDPGAAVADLEGALTRLRAEHGPWLSALLRLRLAHMLAQLGHHEQASRHAEWALPALRRLDAADDVIGAHFVIASAALAGGDFAEARRRLEEVRATVARHSADGNSILGHGTIVSTLQADLLLSGGDTEAGLQLYRRAAEEARAMRVPGIGEVTGLEPWTLYVESAALAAHARCGSPDQGLDLFRSLSSKIVAVLEPGREGIDYPVTGLMLYALAAWGLAGEAIPASEAVRLAVLAERFGYNRSLPTMAWRHVEVPAERAAPGLLAETAAEYGHRRGEQLLPEVRNVIEQLFA
jgi:predicted ATPase